MDRPLSVEDVEFTVLILRICDYAAQLLPSPSHTIDQIRGLSLSDIRSVCSIIGDGLTKICADLDSRGSLIRVQHILFATMKSWCEGKMDNFWKGQVSAIRVAQKVGIHRQAAFGVQELDEEIRRKTFCNLYVMDRCASSRVVRRSRWQFQAIYLEDLTSFPACRMIPLQRS